MAAMLSHRMGGVLAKSSFGVKTPLGALNWMFIVQVKSTFGALFLKKTGHSPISGASVQAHNIKPILRSPVSHLEFRLMPLVGPLVGRDQTTKTLSYISS